jgi:hypothetical protein
MPMPVPSTRETNASTKIIKFAPRVGSKRITKSVVKPSGAQGSNITLFHVWAAFLIGVIISAVIFSWMHSLI